MVCGERGRKDITSCKDHDSTDLVKFDAERKIRIILRRRRRRRIWFIDSETMNTM